MNQDTRRLIDKIAKIRATTGPQSIPLRGAYEKIGMVLSSEMKVAARKKRIIDKGGLINSIGYEFFNDGKKSGLRVGSFGIKYAKFHEYGTQWSRKMWLYMMANRKSWGGKKSKGVLEKRMGGQGIEARIKARPFIRPSIERNPKNRKFIIDTLREALKP